MIESEHFFAALHVLSEVLPYQKQLSPETRGALWELFPQEAKRDLTPADLQWAVSQRLIDPNPPREMAVSFVFLHYLYPKRDGWPAFDAGPRRLDPQASVRDERKVFRAEDVLSRPRSLSAGEFAAHYLQQPKPDADERKVLRAQEALFPGWSLEETLNWGAMADAAFAAAVDGGGLAGIQRGEGPEDPDGPIAPMWTEPNWQGGAGRG